MERLAQCRCDTVAVSRLRSAKVSSSVRELRIGWMAHMVYCARPYDDPPPPLTSNRTFLVTGDAWICDDSAFFCFQPQF
jgi:hypothetical protein